MNGVYFFPVEKQKHDTNFAYMTVSKLVPLRPVGRKF